LKRLALKGDIVVTYYKLKLLWFGVSKRVFEEIRLCTETIGGALYDKEKIASTAMQSSDPRWGLRPPRYSSAIMLPATEPW